MGIIIGNHYKDPYQATSIMASKAGFFFRGPTDWQVPFGSTQGLSFWVEQNRGYIGYEVFTSSFYLYTRRHEDPY